MGDKKEKLVSNQGKASKYIPQTSLKMNPQLHDPKHSPITD